MGQLRAVLLVGTGGMIGAMLRYMMITALSVGAGQPAALGTLAVNVLGSFAIGVLNGYAQQQGGMADAIRLFLVPGILGGFTTFSAFAWDSVSLFEKTGYITSITYISASVTFSVSAVIAGMAVARWIIP